MHIAASSERQLDLAQQFGPLVVALCGRRLQLAMAEAGGLTFTDGVTLFLRREATEHDRLVEITLQCALLAAGSLSESFAFRLVGQPQRASRYLAIEAPRALATASPIFQIIIADTLPVPASMPNSAEASFLLSADRTIAPAADTRLGRIRPMHLLRHRSSLGGGKPSAAEARKLAPMKQSSDDDNALDDDDEAEDISRLARALSGAVSLPFIGSILQKIMSMRRAPGSGEGSGEIPVGSLRSALRTSGNGVRAEYSVNLAAAQGEKLVSRWVYPEWDGFAGRFKPLWCSVHEFPAAWLPPRKSEIGFLPNLYLNKAVQKLARARRPMRRQHDGSDFDLDALVDFVVAAETARRDPQQTTPGKAAIHIAARPGRRDMSALILLDMSGSGAEKQRGGNSVFAEAAQAAAALTHALSLAGDRVATLAFHSRGRHDVRAITLKEFDDRWRHATADRMLSLPPSDYTRLGAAIRHGANRLIRARAEQLMLLFVISDGVAFDLDYVGTSARLDVVHAVQEANERDIAVLWLCFGTMEAALRDFLNKAPNRLLEAAQLQLMIPHIVPAAAQLLYRRKT